MAHFKVEVLVQSPRTEDDLAWFLSGLLRGLDVVDMSVYEVTHMPGHR